MAGWYFKERKRSDEVADPIQGEFFDEAADPDERRRGPAASVVREAIQNSLDARMPRQAVRVRFHLPDEGLPPQRARRWLGELWPHLRARRSGLRRIPTDREPCRFLVVEDFGTSGLEGDPNRGETPDDGNDDFFAFFRANGLSGKGGEKGGRWGVGKTVFNRASRINTFLAMSVRASDGAAHLIGRCFLLTHKVDGTEYHPYGRYGRVTKGGFVLPVEDRQLLDDFRADFQLARDLTTPGLSVVVPYVDKDISVEAVRSAVVREYFWPILAGYLAVEIARSGSSPISLSPDTLLLCADEEDRAGLGNELRSLIQFAIDAHTSPEGGTISLLQPGDPPSWAESLFPDGSLAQLATRYQRGELLAFRVPLLVRKRNGQPRKSSFLVYVRLDRNGKGYPPVFVRSGLIIPKARERRMKGQNVHALVVIDDPSLSSMLGDAETPAHTHWSPDSANFRDKYVHGPAIINFVRSAPAHIVDFIARAPGQRDWFALAEFFPAPAPEVAPPGASTGTDGSAGGGPFTSGASSEPQAYRIDHVIGGFRIVGNPASGAGLPPALRITVAYDTARGDPLKRYHPADFDLSQPPVEIEANAAEITVRSGNKLLARLHAGDFHIEVRGFDVNRDLCVKVEPMNHADAAAEPTQARSTA